MTTYGVTSQGFVPKTIEVIQSELEAAFQTAFGASVQLDPASDFGQLIGIFAEREAELWNLAQAVDANFDPDRATSAGEDSLCAITGTNRLPATQSTVSAFLLGTNGTVVAAGKVASVAVTAVRFDLLASVTITLASAWFTSHGYLVGDVVTNASKLYVCIAAGTSASAPTTTAADITDGTVHWKYVGAAIAYAVGAFKAENTGPLVALAGTLTTIETPVAGWSAVTNLLDATAGKDVESDADLRLRREDELGAQGNAIQDAIRADVLQVSGVTACTVFLNNTSGYDSTGMPPHSIEVLVSGGADADIRAAIWGSIAAGIQSYGNTNGTITDSQGNTQAVGFSRPVATNIYVICNLTYDALAYPADGDAETKAAILAYGNGMGSGRDAVASSLSARAFSIPGVLDVASLYIGTSPGPASAATIAVGLRGIAAFDSSRITIVSTPGTP